MLRSVLRGVCFPDAIRLINTVIPAQPCSSVSLTLNNVTASIKVLPPFEWSKAVIDSKTSDITVKAEGKNGDVNISVCGSPTNEGQVTISLPGKMDFNINTASSRVNCTGKFEGDFNVFCEGKGEFSVDNVQGEVISVEGKQCSFSAGHLQGHCTIKLKDANLNVKRIQSQSSTLYITDSGNFHVGSLFGGEVDVACDNGSLAIDVLKGTSRISHKGGGSVLLGGVDGSLDLNAKGSCDDSENVQVQFSRFDSAQIRTYSPSASVSILFPKPLVNPVLISSHLGGGRLHIEENADLNVSSEETSSKMLRSVSGSSQPRETFGTIRPEDVTNRQVREFASHNPASNSENAHTPLRSESPCASPGEMVSRLSVHTSNGDVSVRQISFVELIMQKRLLRKQQEQQQEQKPCTDA